MMQFQLVFHILVWLFAFFQFFLLLTQCSISAFLSNNTNVAEYDHVLSAYLQVYI